jgi:hypothetical protein
VEVLILGNFDSGNAAPVISGTPSTSATVDTEYTYSPSVSDPGDTITWTLETYPSGMTINSSTGAVAWTPTGEATESVTIRATDTGGEYDEQSWSITATTPSDPTVFAEANATYITFNDFCKEKFAYNAAVMEYDRVSESLSFLSGTDDDWVYESQNSASIAFRTSLPARCQIEYGITDSYGSETDLEERHFFQHMHTIGGLDADTTYHYRLVAEGDGGTIYSEDRTFATATIAGAIRIPEDVEGPPYYLTQGGKTYILTQDLTVPLRGCDFRSYSQILDLNGYTITYDNSESEGTYWADWVYSDTSAFGVYAYTNKGASTPKVFNGRIVQGTQGSAGNLGDGFNPAFLNAANAEIAGVTCIWYGDSITGIHGKSRDPYVHHCVLNDMGTVVDNRSAQTEAIFSKSSDPELELHHNRVSRARQIGINAYKGMLTANEVWVDSYVTNSFALACNTDNSVTEGGAMSNNRVYLTGYHALGGGYAKEIHDNCIWGYSVMTSRDSEYGNAGTAIGLRLTQYNGATKPFPDRDWHDNIIILRGEDGVILRGMAIFSDPEVSNMQVYDNYIKVLSVDGVELEEQGCIHTQGQDPSVGVPGLPDNELPVYCTSNTLVSNVCHIRTADSYGAGCFFRFYDTTFTLIDDSYDFSVIKNEVRNQDSYGHRILDSNLGTGVDLSDTDYSPYSGSGDRNYSVGYRNWITVTDGGTPQTGVDVSVVDDTGTTGTFTTDDSGNVMLEIVEYTMDCPPEATSITQVDHGTSHVEIDGAPYPLSSTGTEVSPFEIDIA